MSFDRTLEKNAEQDNVIDGTVLVFEALPDQGAYVTVAGRDGEVAIVVLDLTDLKVIANKVLPMVDGRIPVTSYEDSMRVTDAGVVGLTKMLGLDADENGAATS